MYSQAKLKSLNFPLSPVEILLFLIALSPSLRLSTSAIENGSNSQNSSENVINKTNVFVRSSPPVKSLYSGQLFQPDAGLMKSLTPYPLRESYIAYEQAHPGDSYSGGHHDSFDQYFKPNKFPPQGSGFNPGFDNSDFYTTRLENSYQHQAPSPQFHPPTQHQSPLYLPLPPPPPPPPFLRLVKLPGKLEVSVNAIGGRNTLEILCEFPGYLLIVQQIYWHVIPPPSSLLLPYGTFYDSRNGFAPRVTVTRISKWKSILRVRDYTPDDFGTYRCVSTAILPDDPEPSYPYPYTPRPTAPPLPPSSYLLHFPHNNFNELRSSASTITSSHREAEEEENLEGKASSRRERRIKFRRSKREVFGVYAPFFKPHYGIYRVFKEVNFFGHQYGAGSEIVENSISPPEETGSGNGGSNGAGKTNQNTSIEDNAKRDRSGRRKFDFVLNRKSKVLF